MKLTLGLVLALLAVQLGTAAAEVRYGLFIGNDRGARDQVTLRYAERDAARVAEVFRDLGGVPAQNAVLLRGGRAAEVRAALIDLNQRIRRDVDQGLDTVLVVYYSGHASDATLHLGDTRLPLAELRALVVGSAASTRVLVLDSCRSGAALRAKGGGPGRPFALRLDQDATHRGSIVISSSAASEDAQESDQLGASVFTHFWVSGLLGAADADRDRRVSVAEAYAYAYASTVRLSSAQAPQVQHPTYQLDVQGAGELALSWLDGRGGDRRGTLRFATPGEYLVFRAGAGGAVVGEVVGGTGPVELAVPAGAYLVRQREPASLREATVEVGPGEVIAVDRARWRRFRYARLVRKGAAALARAAAITGYGAAHTPLQADTGAGVGVGAAYELALPALTLATSMTWTRAVGAMPALPTASDYLQVAVSTARYLDRPRWSLAVTASVGGLGWYRRYHTRGEAPGRLGAGALFGVGVNLRVPLGARTWLGGRVEATAIGFRERDAVGVGWTSSIVLGGSLGLGWEL